MYNGNYKGNANWDDEAYKKDREWEADRTKKLNKKYKIYSKIYPGSSKENKSGIDCILVNGWTVDNKFRRKPYQYGEKLVVELRRNNHKYTGQEMVGRLYTGKAMFQLIIYNDDTAYLVYIPWMQQAIREDLGVETDKEVQEICKRMQQGNYAGHDWHLRLAQQPVDNVLWQFTIEEMAEKHPEVIKKLDLATGNVYNLDGTLLKNIKEEQDNESV